MFGDMVGLYTAAYLRLVTCGSYCGQGTASEPRNPRDEDESHIWTPRSLMRSSILPIPNIVRMGTVIIDPKMRPPPGWLRPVARIDSGENAR